MLSQTNTWVKLITLLLFAAGLGGVQWARAEVPEPSALWTGPMRGETPETLQGATVLDLERLEALMAANPVLLDVGLADKKPEGFPEGRLWLPTHRSIPGAIWFPGGGAADLTVEQEDAFFQRVEELTQGDKSTPVVTFCRPKCWGSWNAGKRLVTRGYTAVQWFPGGIEQWQEAHEVIEVTPDKAWPAESGR